MGSNSSVSDACRSFYDMEEAEDQVFSHPLLMDMSLLADLYEDLVVRGGRGVISFVDFTLQLLLDVSYPSYFPELCDLLPPVDKLLHLSGEEKDVAVVVFLLSSSPLYELDHDALEFL
ncbi:hypothetical protein RND71_034069 [Anisodus tanguticus]|uniref:Uncharacterized protein n=1 Tax=Anisodus tanguticus TaxID=243964 RepID=A0AAE1R9S3_9SOLA|nr:hypothetical protein RND71_034069 [Anisodus tanguticus]